MIGTTTQFSSGENPIGDQSQPSPPTPITPKQEPSVQKPRGFSLITSVALAITLIFALIAIAVYITVRSKQSSLNKIDSQIATVNQQINQKPDLEKAITAIYGQVTNLDQVLAQRNLWSRFLNEVADKNTLKSQYLSINASDLSKINISGRAASYTSVAYLVKSFQNSEYFSQVTLTNASKEGIAESSINFTIEASMSPALLVKESATAAPSKDAVPADESQSAENNNDQSATPSEN